MPSENYLVSLLKISYLCCLAIFLLDAAFYSGFVKNHFFLSPLTFSMIALIVHSVIRFKFKVTLSDNFATTNLFILFPTALILALGIFVLEEGMLFPNYFFANFKFHYPVIKYMSLAFLGFGLIYASENFYNAFKVFYKKHWKTVSYWTSALLLIAIWVLFVADERFYLSITKEDGLVENLTCLGFLSAGILSFLIAKVCRRANISNTEKAVLTVIFSIAAVSFVLVALEEISWGQRIFGFETPDSLKDVNTQAEINIHNNKAIWPMVYTGYALIGIYGGFAWLIKWVIAEYIKQKKVLNRWLSIFVPSGFLSLTFLFNLTYVWLRKNHGPWKYVMWEEVSEFVLALGIVVVLVHAHKTVKDIK